MHMTEMIIYDFFRFNLPLATIPAIIIATTLANCCLCRFQPRLFSGPEIFIPDVYGTKKPAPENGVDLWCRFLERVLWV